MSKIFSCLANRSSAPHDLKGDSLDDNETDSGPTASHW